MAKKDKDALTEISTEKETKKAKMFHDNLTCSIVCDTFCVEVKQYAAYS